MNMHTEQGTCFHCSEPLPHNNAHAYSAILNGQQCWFCCPACQTVAETIQGLGLGAYYNQRDSKPEQPAATARDWSEMDLPAVQSTFVTKLADHTEQVDLLIPDIHCASCCWLIENRLRHIPEVLSVHASLAQQKVSVRWRKETLQPSILFASLAEIGYRTSPWQESARQAESDIEQSRLLRKTGVAGLVAMQIHMIAMGSYFGAGLSVDASLQHMMNAFALLLSIPVWFYAATPFFSSAWRHFRAGSLGMDVPVCLAIITAAIASIIALIEKTNDVYFDSIAMFVFLLLGARYLEARARNRLAVHAQLPELPLSCIRISGNAAIRVGTSELHPGDIIKVVCGEIIAADGIVTNGQAAVEEALLTGEFMPVQKSIGDSVLAGTLIREGELKIQVRHWGNDSRLVELHQRMENALESRQQTQLHDQIAHWFTPAVLLLAICTAIYWLVNDPTRAVPAVLAVLVASCPCALSLAIPTAQAAATLQLRKQGILVTANHALLSIPKIRCWVFDKTGTLTNGRFSIISTETLSDIPIDECFDIARALEAHTTHPVASAFTGPSSLKASDIQIFPHLGVAGTISQTRYQLGSPAWCLNESTNTHLINLILTDEHGPIARFIIGDHLREDAPELVSALRQQGYHCAMLSGDHSHHVDEVANATGITDFVKGCNPESKVARLITLRQSHGSIAMLGDGINDGPVLAQADLSISLAEASRTARMAADILLLNNRLSDIRILMDTARKTSHIATQNIIWAFSYNILILPMAAAGYLPPAVAAIGMATSSLAVTFNALRLFIKPAKSDQSTVDKQFENQASWKAST